MQMKERVEEVRNNIRMACERAGRNLDEVTLIAVSKMHTIEELKEARDLGLYVFGENKVQELVGKYDAFPEDQKWHLIGHLQRNKVKYIIDKVEMIHSVDSLRLAEAIDKEAKKCGIVMPILIEVNVADEDSKFGVAPEDVEGLVREIAGLEGVKVSGLMTVAPYVDDPEENRPIFSRLRQISVDIAGRNIDNVTMNVLSMGMTNDYVVAIEEGATMVRVGTAIFGERNYQL